MLCHVRRSYSYAVSTLFPNELLKALYHQRERVADPLPPSQLEVLTNITTTSSVTVTWKYDPHQSHIEKWRVQYTVKGKSDVNYIDSESADVLQMTITNLTSGENYTIVVYGVTYTGVTSLQAQGVNVTVGMYFVHSIKNYMHFELALFIQLITVHRSTRVICISSCH